jgi:hypothetical protein
LTYYITSLAIASVTVYVGIGRHYSCVNYARKIGHPKGLKLDILVPFLADVLTSNLGPIRITLGMAGLPAIRSGWHDKAVELLEEGHAVFWTQALQLPKPMMDLRDAAPELEERLRRISIALEQGSFRDSSRSLSDSHRK